jgi:glycerate kinase
MTRHGASPRPLRVLVAPSGFKEGLDVSDVAAAMARGVRRALPGCDLSVMPVFDGGEGFTRALVRLHNGRTRRLVVAGPLGDPVDAAFGMVRIDGARTAVIEISAAAGLRLVPRNRRHRLTATSSRGVGELMRAALDAGAERILVGCGDSGVNDGGAGLATALGARFLDRRGRDLPPGGAALAQLQRVDLSGLDPRIRDVNIDVCLNIHNMLLGRYGVSRVFGPQKGASLAQVERLEAGLRRYAKALKVATGIDAAALPGGGASGGLGAALHLMLGARLVPRYDFIERHIPLTDRIDWADLIVSAEGRIDRQTCRGKIPGEIARRAQARGKPVIVLAGAIGEGAVDCYAGGVSAFVSIIDQPYNLEQAIGGTPRLLAAGTEHVMRIVAVGGSLAGLNLRTLAAGNGG